NPPSKRIPDEQIARRFDPNNPAPAQPPFPVQPQPAQTPKPDALPPARINEIVNKFLLDNGVKVRINDAGREHGQIRAFANPTYDPAKV
ncbi:hypothetical protein J0689_25975, partial [Vibrio parahaemolyticus]|uniref:hypothetical protein n=1 Tax=Vibrio parahaemolyticus TaxID=670 RepID=UPI001A8D7190